MIKKIKSQVIFLLSLSLILLAGCEKDEGVGGTSKIVGTLIEKTYSEDFSRLYQTRPAIDEDVFIVYGDDLTIGEKIATNYNGQFEFPFLREGDYTLFYLSESLDHPGEGDMEVLHQVSLSKGQTIDLGELIQIKTDDALSGSGKITGSLMMHSYDDAFTNLQDVSPAVDEDIFILFGDDEVVGDKTSTSYNGKFEFSFLREGDYSIFYMTEDSLHPTNSKKEVLLNVTVTNGETVDLGELAQYQSLDFDEGASLIKGRVRQINYWKQSVYPNLISKDTTIVQELEVYITYGVHTFYDERIRTQEDGTFEFTKLLKGDYKIVVYSEDVSGGEANIPVVSNATVLDHGQEIDLGDIFIKNH